MIAEPLSLSDYGFRKLNWIESIRAQEVHDRPIFCPWPRRRIQRRKSTTIEGNVEADNGTQKWDNEEATNRAKGTEIHVRLLAGVVTRGAGHEDDDMLGAFMLTSGNAELTYRQAWKRGYSLR